MPKTVGVTFIFFRNLSFPGQVFYKKKNRSTTKRRVDRFIARKASYERKKKKKRKVTVIVRQFLYSKLPTKMGLGCSGIMSNQKRWYGGCRKKSELLIFFGFSSVFKDFSAFSVLIFTETAGDRVFFSFKWRSCKVFDFWDFCSSPEVSTGAAILQLKLS